MPTPIYASHLVGLLRDLGLTQQELAMRLHVPTGSVSMWATGKRAVPRRHLTGLLKVIREVIRHDRGAHMGLIRVALLQWEREMSVKIGHWSRMVQAFIQQLEPYAKVDLLTLDRRDRRYVESVTRTLLMHLEYLDMPGAPYELIDHGDTFINEELLDHICRFFGIDEEGQR